MIITKQFNLEDYDKWNEFVLHSKNGTFQFNRRYMDYHCDRFIDNSLIFTDEKDNILAIFPANKQDNILTSHGGLTYGGLILAHNIYLSEVLSIFDSLLIYAKENAFVHIIYKCMPVIYHKYPAQEDLYALFKLGAFKYRTDVSCAIQVENRIAFNSLRKRFLKKAQKEPLIVKESDDFDWYFNLVSKILLEKHNATPTHTAKEMQLLNKKFPDNIKLLLAYSNDTPLGGIIAYITETVFHYQYIAITEEGRNLGALELITDYIICHFYNKKYINYGISTENSGYYLNENLHRNKESFGARTIVHDFYKINI